MAVFGDVGNVRNAGGDSSVESEIANGDVNVMYANGQLKVILRKAHAARLGTVKQSYNGRLHMPSPLLKVVGWIG
jgi:hypothetical protein